MTIGVSLQTLVDIEAGKPGVSIGKILQVANGLGVSLFVLPHNQREIARRRRAGPKKLNSRLSEKPCYF